MTYNDTPLHEPFWFELGPISDIADTSIGIVTLKDGTVFDVVPGSPAYDAGLGPHMTILAVNGHVYSANSLNDAITHPPNGKITLIMRNFDSVEIHELKYAGGLRYSHLERIPGTRDFLSEILAPRNYKQQ